MEKVAQWIVGAVMVLLVWWLVAKLRSHRKAWERSERERIAMQAETEYWRKVAESAAQRAKHLALLTQDVETAMPSRREFQAQLYEKAKARAMSRRMSDRLDNGAGVPLHIAEKGE